MHLFISAGEPSGDLHGANLLKALRRLDPSIKCVGFGGERMRAAGFTLLYSLTKLAVMGFLGVFLNILSFIRLTRQARRYFRDEKPNAVILIDFPGFHWGLAKRAHDLGIPVYYFVPPQIWAWRSGRVKKMKKWVTHVLSALPFEHDWFQERGVKTTYIGHPYFDELAAQRLAEDFIAEQRQQTGRVIAILPGSRMGEVTKNLAEMLEAATIIHSKVPDTRFLIASYNDVQAEVARQLIADLHLPVEVHVGRTPEIIEIAEACISVSGSVSLEMMYRLKPATIVYRLSRISMFIARQLVHCKYMTLVNLLADRAIYPEIATTGNPATWLAEQVLVWLENPAKADEVRQALRELKERFAKTGACEQAASVVMEEIGKKQLPKRAAA